ncbi:thioredoxin domain-containing protein [Candidatus Saccharibacteria bacterium]|nr:thioredoxin domain-containing protein [Candidatus Saccharibacteria bacterium]
MNKFTIGAIIAILACFGGLIAWSTMKSQDTKSNISEYSSKKLIAANEENGGIADRVRGSEDAKVLVVEYADFECSGCAAAAPKISQLYEQYQDRVQFVFRNYPLQYHQNARAAAAAAEAAGMQGKYWEMMESLYSNRADWIEESEQTRTDAFAKIFKDIAENGDEEQFRADMGSENIKKKIDFDRDIGKAEGVDATPTFYVNGEKVDFSSENGDVKTLVEAKIKKALGE